MATLENQTIASTYTMLLKTTAVVDGTLRKVEDGAGTDTALMVSTTGIAIDAGDEFYLDGGGDTYIHYASTDTLEFVIGGVANSFVLKETGSVTKVGIGTSTPDEHFHIIGSSGGEFKIGAESTGSAIIVGASDYLRFLGNDGSAEYMRISDGGNVGIGTIYPGGKNATQNLIAEASTLLEIAGTGGDNDAATLVLRQTATSITSSTDRYLGKIKFVGNDVNGTSESGLGAMISADAATSWGAGSNEYPTELQFWTNDATSANIAQRMVIDKDGKVGIGQLGPSYMIDLLAPSGTEATIQIRTSRNDLDDCSIRFNDNGNLKWAIINDAGSSHILDVIDASGDGVYLPQNQSGLAWSDSSDLNLKTDISVLSDALSKVNQIRGVNYKWKKYKEGAANPNPADITSEEWLKMRAIRDTNRVGVIAQEVEEVLPEAVVKDKGDGNWGVQYTGLIPLLIEAVKELSAKVTALENA